jgi:pimeloyl-ACP methyl ester carboxylesterase
MVPQLKVGRTILGVAANIIVPDAGHFVPEERPAELTAALKTFFAR